MSGWQVGADVRMVSIHGGKVLFSATGSRYAVDFMPAFDPIDIAVSSTLTLLELRDVTLARAEEEDAREIALRIPRSPRVEDELIEAAQGGDMITAQTQWNTNLRQSSTLQPENSVVKDDALRM